MSEHRDYAKFSKTEEPSGEHFNSAGHSFHNLQGLAVEQVRSKDPFILKARETMLIKKFDSFRNGLNKEPWNNIQLASVGLFYYSFDQMIEVQFWLSYDSICVTFWSNLCCEHELKARNILAFK